MTCPKVISFLVMYCSNEVNLRGFLRFPIQKQHGDLWRLRLNTHTHTHRAGVNAHTLSAVAFPFMFAFPNKPPAPPSRRRVGLSAEASHCSHWPLIGLVSGSPSNKERKWQVEPTWAPSRLGGLNRTITRGVEGRRWGGHGAANWEATLISLHLPCPLPSTLLFAVLSSGCLRWPPPFQSPVEPSCQYLSLVRKWFFFFSRQFV